MKVDRHPEILRGLEYGRDRGVIEEYAICLSKDHRSDKTKFMDGPLQLRRSGDRIRHGECRKCAQPIRIFSNRASHPVVRLSRQGDRLRWRELLEFMRNEREDLEINPCSIHPVDPPLTHVVKRVRKQGGQSVLPRSLGNISRQYVFFQSDRSQRLPLSRASKQVLVTDTDLLTQKAMRRQNRLHVTFGSKSSAPKCRGSRFPSDYEFDEYAVSP